MVNIGTGIALCLCVCVCVCVVTCVYMSITEKIKPNEKTTPLFFYRYICVSFPIDTDQQYMYPFVRLFFARFWNFQIYPLIDLTALELILVSHVYKPHSHGSRRQS